MGKARAEIFDNLIDGDNTRSRLTNLMCNFGEVFLSATFEVQLFSNQWNCKIRFLEQSRLTVLFLPRKAQTVS